MKKLITITMVVVVSMLYVNVTKAATLDRGVSTSPMFTAGGSANGNAMIAQLKYQMAVDSKIGIKDRYKTIYTTNVYHNYSYDSHDTTTTTVSYDSHESYDSHDTVISVNAKMGKGEIMLNTNPITYKDNASPTVISVNAEIGEGEIVLNTE